MNVLTKTAFAASMIAGLAAADQALIADQALAAEFTLDTPGMHAAVNFRASHLGYSFVTGRFDKFSGAFSFDKDKPTEAKVTIEIDATSLNTNHVKRDDHLRSADFFDTANHPTAKFESTAVEVTGNNAAKITGNLTLRGVTKPVTLNASYIGEGKDPWGGYRAGFTATGEITPADFGMPHGVAKGPVQLMIEAEGTRN